MRLRVLVALALLLIAGCCKVPVQMVRLPATAPVEPPPAFWLFADTQLNHVAGAATPKRTAAADWFGYHAIRPPAVDLWAETLLASIVGNMKATPIPAVFLGDAANTSCVSEYQRFLDQVSAGSVEADDRLRWFGVLGNHDGYYFGNTTFAADAYMNPAPGTWQGACDKDKDSRFLAANTVALRPLELALLGQDHSNAEQNTLTKAVAVWMYLRDLESRFAAAPLIPSPMAIDSWDRMHDANWATYKGVGTYRVDGKTLGYTVHAAVGRQARHGDNTSRSWQAYVLQDVALPGGAHVLLIDTSDFGVAPRIDSNKCDAAGRCGAVSDHQAAQLREIIRGLVTTKTPFFVAGHHNWGSLTLETAGRIKYLPTQPGFLAYLSAHEHYLSSTVGYLAEENHVDLHHDWEINLASVTDHPMQYARMGYSSAVVARHRNIAIDVLPSVLPTELEACFLASPMGAQDEMAYGSVDRYVHRAFTDYAALFVEIQRRGLRSACPDDEALSYAQRVSSALNSTEYKANGPRTILASVIDFDRRCLRTVPEIAKLERNCVVWGSGLEGAKNHIVHPVAAGHVLPLGRTEFGVPAR